MRIEKPILQFIETMVEKKKIIINTHQKNWTLKDAKDFSKDIYLLKHLLNDFNIKVLEKNNIIVLSTF